MHDCSGNLKCRKDVRRKEAALRRNLVFKVHIIKKRSGPTRKEPISGRGMWRPLSSQVVYTSRKERISLMGPDSFRIGQCVKAELGRNFVQNLNSSSRFMMMQL
jgi:hypothetical protein